MKILVTGTRQPLSSKEQEIILEILQHYKDEKITLIHGNCSGVDKFCGEIAKLMGWQIKSYPADWKKYGRAAGPIRNRQMCDQEAPDIVYAFPSKESIGTYDCINYAKSKGIQVITTIITD